MRLPFETTNNCIDWKAIMASPLCDALHSLEGVQQNPMFHGEGDVWSHTKLVCESLVNDPAWQSLESLHKNVLFYAALLHDIGKPKTTKKIDDVWHSPFHTVTGSKIARKLLWKDCELAGEDDAYEFREAVCTLIRLHSRPNFFLSRVDNDSDRAVIELAAWSQRLKLFSLRMLSILVRADLNGRIADDKQKMLENLDLFVSTAEDLDVLDSAPKFSNAWTQHQWFLGKTSQVDAGLYDPTWDGAIMMCGLPGTGKGTYIDEHFSGLPVISLDEIRRELRIKNGANQSPVVAEALEKAKAFLRKKQKFIWDATCIAPEFRSKQLKLFHDYGARTKIIWLETSWNENLKRNRERKAFVPEDVIDKMLDKFQPPQLGEAVEVEHICI